MIKTSLVSCTMPLSVAPWPVKPKRSYHPYILLGFYLGILPDHLLQQIPCSTRHDWKQRHAAVLFGYEWYLQHQPSFTVMQQVFNNSRLLKINRALLRIIALSRFMDRYQVRIKDKIGSANAVVLDNIAKVAKVLSVATTLRYLQLPAGRYRRMQQTNRCSQSLFSQCRSRHPAQLLHKEVAAIKEYCSDQQWQSWPLSSVYHQMIRDRAAVCTIATFYKYVRLMALQRKRAAHRRKHHQVGIRAAGPLQILHVDVTVFRTMDNVRNYIYLVVDNYSRAILAWEVALECNARYVFRNLQKVIREHLQPAGISTCQLISDDGSENYGPVKSLVNQPGQPHIRHLIAQCDIAFSNSMSESVNKQAKYHYLYHHPIADHAALRRHMPLFVEAYANRPLAALKGLTSTEVLGGQRYDRDGYRQQIATARANRIATNKKATCCYSF
ncbi:hypothetical protein [Paraflavitalea speifideaquila]|uniref:hypothetical protein n=1 Tax=Paraflavitalea speifideaquila TaxID=3076558 RepID=UPI0028EB87C0|nr:hypothetical protein [Paraflavitalea speifideiaquila]